MEKLSKVEYFSKIKIILSLLAWPAQMVQTVKFMLSNVA